MNSSCLPFGLKFVLRPLAAAVSLAVAFSPLASAADGTWVGSSLGGVGVGSPWATAANWSGGIVPGATSGTTNTDTAFFNVAGTWTVAATANLNIGNLTFGTVGAAPNYFMITAGSTMLTSNNALIQADNTFRGNAGVAGPNAGQAITMQGNLTLQNNGLVGSSMAFNAITTAASLGNVRLTLDGSNSGLTNAFGSRMNGIISQNATGTTLSVVKNGTGTWTLAGANTYTGGTTINGGTIIALNATALGSSGTITIGGNSTIRAATNLTDPSSRILINDGVTLTYDTAGNTPTWAGVVQNSGGSNTAGFTKTGLGTLTLTPAAGQAQTWRGTTTVNMGVLSISGASQTGNFTNLVNPNSNLVLGGGNIGFRGAGNTTTNSQTFASTTLNPGVSGFIPASGSGSNTFEFGTITRNSGALLDIVNATGYTFKAGATTNNAGGLVKGILFAGDFATVSSGNLVATTYTTQNAANLWTSGTTNYVTNAAVTGTVGTGATTTINALKLNFGGSNSFTINGTLALNDGLIFGSGIGNNVSQISGGNITSGSGDLIIVNNNNLGNTFGRNTITSTIVDNGSPTNVILYNRGNQTTTSSSLYIAGNNTYTGNTYIGGGSNSQVGSFATVVGGAAGASIGSANATVFLNGGSGGNNNVLRVGNGDATGDVLGTIRVDNGRLALNRNDTFTLSAVVAGSAGGGFVFQEGTGTGTINFAAGNNFFSGLGNTGAGGTLILEGAGSVNNFQTQNWANTTGFVPTSTTTFNSGTYNFSSPGNAGTNGVGTWNINGATVVTTGRYFASGGGTVNLSAGTLRFNGDSLESGQQSAGNIAFNISGGKLHVPSVSNSGGTASWGIGTSTSATGNYIVTQSGGEVSVGMPENAVSLSTVGGQSIVIGVAGETAARTNTYALSGGILRVAGGITSPAAAFTGGSHNFNWTGGRLTTVSYNGTNITSNNGITSGTGTLNQGGNTSIMAPGETYEGVLFTGRTAITGGYRIDAGTVAIGIGGTTAATVFHNTSTNTHDQITVTGATVLGGRLALSLNNGYTPPSDTTTLFNILTGSASGITGSFANGVAASGGNTRVVLADGLSSMLVAVNNTGSTASVGGLTNVGAYRVAVGGYQATNTYNAATGSSWDAASAASWTNFDAGSSSGASGAIAQFADGAGTGSGNNTVNLNSTRNVRGIEFSTASAGKNYTIANAGSGAITFDNTANSAAATLNDSSASGNTNTIAVPLTLTSNLAVSITNASNRVVVSGIISGTARSLTKTGAGTLELQGVNTYTGATAVNAGTLLVNGSTASGSAVTVASGATLGGNGTIGGSVTLDGILAPGNSIGTLSIGGDLTWNTSGSLLTELGTAGVSIASFGTSDQVAITGNFNKGTGTTFAFDFGGTGELGWYRLANWGGTTTFTDTDFTATNLGSGLGANFQIDSGALYLNVIPEPSTYALVALGLGGLLLLRRRQRQA